LFNLYIFYNHILFVDDDDMDTKGTLSCEGSNDLDIIEEDEQEENEENVDVDMIELV